MTATFNAFCRCLFFILMCSWQINRTLSAEVDTDKFKYVTDESQLSESEFTSFINGLESDSKIFITLNDEVSIKQSVNHFSDYSKWQMYKYPCVAISEEWILEFAGDKNQKELFKDLHYDQRPISWEEYARKGCPVVLFARLFFRDEHTTYYKINLPILQGKINLQQITDKEEYMSLNKKYFSFSDDGFYAMFESKWHQFFKIAKHQAATDTPDEMKGKWLSGLVDKIEYIPVSDGIKVRLIHDGNFKKSMSVIITDGQNEKTRAFSETQWHRFIKYAHIKEIRYFLNNTNAFVYKCGLDWNSQVGKRLFRQINEWDTTGKQVSRLTSVNPENSSSGLLRAPMVQARETTNATASLAKEQAIIKTSEGTMVLEFYPDLAPGHVENFKKLARKGFYDGTCFHRVIRGFMIQGGDPNTKSENAKESWGMGGPGYSIKAEFNVKHHAKGILSMARSQDPNSGGSQFFICAGEAGFLDGQYTVFGNLIKGFDVLDKIAATTTEPPDRPVKRITVESVCIIPCSK